MSTDLDLEVRSQLEARRGEWPRIAERADVSHSWISQFVRRKIPNPGFETLKRLHTALGEPKAQPAAESSTVPRRRAGDLQPGSV